MVPKYNGPKLITPVEPIPEIKSIPEVSAIQQIKPVKIIPSLTLQEQQYNTLRNYNQTETFLANYNDPTELNSFIDALTNREAVSKKFGDTWGTISTASGIVAVLSFGAAAIAAAAAPFTAGATLPAAAVLAKTGLVASIPAIPAAADVTIEKGIKPIIAGKPKEAFINTLVNLGETLDFAANPVKGLIMEGPQGFAKATGLADGGRVNYDFDTGSLLADILLEIAIDPLNYVDFGTTGVIKAGSKSLAQPIIRELSEGIRQSLQETTIKGAAALTETNFKNIEKEITKDARKIIEEYSGTTINKIDREALQTTYRNRMRQSIVRAIKKELPDATSTEVSALLKKTNRDIVTKRFTQAVDTRLNQNFTLDRLTNNILRSVSDLRQQSDNFQKYLFKASLYSSSFGLGFAGLRKGWNIIKTWQNNRTMENLSLPGYFKKGVGIDFAKYTATKEYWQANEKYMTITGEQVSPRTLETFYAGAQEQLRRDQLFVLQILQNNDTALSKTAALDSAFTNLYGYDFVTYLRYLEAANVLENGKYTEFVRWFTDRLKLLKNLATNPKPSTHAFYAKTPRQVLASQQKLLDKLQQLSKKTPKIKDALDTIYSTQINIEYVVESILYDKDIQVAFTELANTQQGIGKFLDKTASDIQAHTLKADAEILDAITSIRQATENYFTLFNFYEDFAALELPAIKGIDTDTFKRYVRDQIFGFQKTVNELLAQFDTLTMPALMSNLETFLFEYGFKAKDYPGLQEQIGSVFKSLLENMSILGTPNLNMTILPDFTNKVTILSEKFLSKFPDHYTEFQNVINASNAIRTLLSRVKQADIDTLNMLFNYNILTQNKITTRSLSDAGIALKTVATKETQKYFVFPQSISNQAFKEALDVGNRLSKLEDRFKQYIGNFDKEDLNDLVTLANKALHQYRNRVQFLKEINFSSLRYIKDTQKPEEAFAIIHTLKQRLFNTNFTNERNAFIILISSVPTENGLNKTISTNVSNMILAPEKVLVTDFAWNAMNMSAWAAARAHNTDILNIINKYTSCQHLTGKTANDFLNIRQDLSDLGMDRPLAIRLERNAAMLKDIQKFYVKMEKAFDAKFDKKLAEAKIEELRDVLLNFPDLEKKYTDLVNTLEAYWRGEKIFKQDSKADIKNGRLPDGTPAVDEYTKFWNDIKEMTQTMNREIKVYNDSIKQIQKTAYQDYRTKKNQLYQATYQTLLDKNAQAKNLLKTNNKLTNKYKENYLEFKNTIDINYRDFLKTNRENTAKALEEYRTAKADIKAQYFNPIEVTPWDPIQEQIHFNKLLSTASDSNALGTLVSYLDNSPEEFIKRLAYAHGLLTFSSSDISEKFIKKKFTKLKKALENKGVHFMFDEDTQRWWIFLDKSFKLNMDNKQLYINGEPVYIAPRKATFSEFLVADKDTPGLHITETLNKWDKDMETLTGTSLGYSQGEIFDLDTAQKILDQMPKEVRALFDEERFLDKQFYKHYIFNESILGTAASKRQLGMYSGNNVLINMSNAYVQSAHYVKAKTEYVHAVFDSMLSIGSPNSIWKEFTDTELMKALQQNQDYMLTTLTHSKKYGIKIVHILPTSPKAIAKAREYGAVIVPQQVFKDMYNTINHRVGSTGFAKLWSKLIYLFKFGYLLRPGAWIRNFIDTNVKTMIETDNEYSTYINQAHKILDEYDDIKRFVSQRADNNDGLITTDAIKEYFDLGLNKTLTYNQFQELNEMVFQQGVNQNVMSDLYAGPGKDVWQTITYYSGLIIDSVNKTEHYNRLALYLYYLDKGYDNTKALSKLAKVHFDYKFKNKAEQLAELVFPFTTFTLRNFSYWVEAVEKHPWILRNYTNIMSPAWDLQDYTPEQIATNRRIQNQIVYGQLPLAKFKDKTVVFKANPSIQDALQMFSDPINNIYDKLVAPGSYPLEALQGEQPNVTNLIPVIGPMIQSAQQMAKSGTPIPSAIGVYKTPKSRIKFTNNNLIRSSEYTDETYRTPKYRNNIVFDSYKTIGAKRYRINFYPLIDIAHAVKMQYSINVYNKIKNKVQVDAFKGLQYSMKLDANRLRY